MIKKFLNSLKSGAEWAELLWKIIALILVIFGTTATALLAKASTQINQLGSFVWVAVGIISCLIFTLIVYLVNLSKKKNSETNMLNVEANYLASLASPKSSINPLSEVFQDQVIYLPDLYLPRKQLHKNKLFKRCKIVGPGAIALLGGSYMNSSFSETGSIIVLPDETMLTGVLVLENCTVDECELIGVTILTNEIAGQAFKKMGAHLAGDQV